MKPQDAGRMFNFTFEKSAAEVKEKATKKISSLTFKIAEREVRIERLRKEHGIDDKALISLLTAAREQQNAQRQSFTYFSNHDPNGADGEVGELREREVGAGVVNFLLTENDFIQTEKSNVKRLETLVRNLRPLKRFADGNGSPYTEDSFQLSYDELTYLGF